MSTGVSSNANEEETKLRRGPWTLEEDDLLVRYITCNGEGRWNLLAKCAGLKRTGKSCRLRWLNYLKPDIKRGNLTHHEQLLILELHYKWGNRWSKIAQHLPGRTDNEIKNYWRTRVQKQARHLKIESNSKRFLEAIRCVWMPRLIEQMEQTSSLSPSPYSTPATVLESQCSAVSPMLLKLQASFPQSAKSSDSFDQPIQNLRSMSTSSIFVSDDSLRDSQLQPETSEYLASPAHHAFGYTNYNSSLLTSGGFHDVKEFNQLDSSMSAVGLNDFPISDSQLAGNDWIGVDMACTLWNMDEMGQFRQPEVLLGI